MANHIHRKELQVSRTKQTPAQLEKYRQFSMCINCGLCYAACPQFGLNPEFLGPAAITMAHRYNLDNRDHGKAKRMSLLNGKTGLELYFRWLLLRVVQTCGSCFCN